MPSRPRVFIDTNIALDLLQNREPFVWDALQLFAMAENRMIELCLSADALSTIFFVIEKNENAATARIAIAKLLDYVMLCALDENAVLRGMSLDMADIEDAFVCAVAEKANALVIITRNVKDFTNCPVMVSSPQEFLAAWRAKHG